MHSAAGTRTLLSIFITGRLGMRASVHLSNIFWPGQEIEMLSYLGESRGGNVAGVKFYARGQ